MKHFSILESRVKISYWNLASFDYDVKEHSAPILTFDNILCVDKLFFFEENKAVKTPNEKFQG
jgi:hypothetical protein